MLGKMIEMPLTISSLIAHAARFHGRTEIATVETSGGLLRTSWGEVEANARQLAQALGALGLEQGARCATIAWNNRRHLEIYFGVAGAGMVCHTINPRLAPEQLIFIANDAQDRVLFVDRTFLPTVVKLRPHLNSVETVVLMGPRDVEAEEMLEGVVFYDELVAGGDDGYVWPELDERLPSSLCYTSGTTGNPKGVLYSHRSTVLHSIGGNQPDGLAISARDTVLPVVPMFHVNAWGVPYVAAAVGAKLVLPGPGLDGRSLVALIDGERVTLALGVPTIWMGLLAALEETGSQAASLQRTVVGGSALPPSMVPIFRDLYGVSLVHAWGMTETSPLGTLNNLLQKHDHLPQAKKDRLKLGQGRPPWGVNLRLVDEAGAAVPEDGITKGNLQIRGPWIVDTYFGSQASALTADGWFDTGDVATLDGDGYVVIRDRAKDIIKSGGEWISTVELEGIAMALPGIANAAAIAGRHVKWGERPVLVAVRKPRAKIDEAEVLAGFEGKVPSWQVPEKVIFVDALPLGATGKVVKARLREEFGDVLL